MKSKMTVILLVLIAAAALAGCGSLTGGGEQALTASGMISAVKIDISPEIGGKVTEVYVQEGRRVQAGDALLKIEDTILQAQYDQALAAADVAAATVSAAEAQLESARLQAQIALQGSRLMDQQNRAAAWLTIQPTEVETPAWYFDKSETIQALQSEIEAAQTDLAIRQQNLANVLSSLGSQDFVEVEVRLAKAQAAFSNAAYTLQQAQAATDNAALEDAAQRAYDAALSELEAAQTEYDRLLTTSNSAEVLEARAQVAVARTRLQNAQDKLALLQSGDDSLQVQAANAAVVQAEKALEQARANARQAEAAIALIEIQLDKTTLKAPISGEVLYLGVDQGELAAPGAVAATLADLNQVSLTVYVPEDQYGRIQLGQDAIVTVDSFPEKSFTGEVTYIADEAEFTPRNVQTVEGRTSTVFAVKITLVNYTLELKPGMPADVSFPEK